MKRLTILASVLVAATLLTSLALAAQHQMPGQPPGQPPMMGQGMMGGGMMGQGMMGQGMMMCPMMGGMGQGMMGGSMDPKTQGRMLQMRGEMFKAQGDILLKYGKMLEEGK